MRGGPPGPPRRFSLAPRWCGPGAFSAGTVFESISSPSARTRSFRKSAQSASPSTTKPETNSGLEYAPSRPEGPRPDRDDHTLRRRPVRHGSPPTWATARRRPATCSAPSRARGTAALRPFRGGPALDAQRLGEVTGDFRELLRERRTWTGRQLTEALAGRGIATGPRDVRRD